MLGAFTLLLAGCPESSSTTVDDQGARVSSFDWGLPESIPLPREPDDNPMTEEKFQLGRHLFYDSRLSTNGTVSCASCHHQDKAFSDGVARPFGATGEQHSRNSQPLVNVAWAATVTWGNPSLGSIERQILLPLFGDDPVEHGLNEANSEQVLRALQGDPTYASLFLAAFPEQNDPLFGDLAWDNVVKALASFVRGLVSFDSPFDRGELSPAALRGERLFNSERLECFHCHAGYNFSDATVDRLTTVNQLMFHNTGLYNIDGMGGYPEPNTGRHEVTGVPDHMGQFRAPTLRNIALTAPYNHDGSVETLGDVIRNYAAGGRLLTGGATPGDGRMNPYKDGFITSFAISEEEIDEVVEFLESLTDESFVTNPRFSNPWPGTSQETP
ncbi:MbnH family di-heme enzyme [Marinobacter sp. F3R08]|uniref:MbnH family di-heme enzyme n=1 Tax=Marinobacter sp. F3R08 TaxID=2841559 RepID=UPI002B1CCBC9|nr:MbnH family di-heme enzyme [Marinobacter sp. F3R08]